MLTKILRLLVVVLTSLVVAALAACASQSPSLNRPAAIPTSSATVPPVSPAALTSLPTNTFPPTPIRPVAQNLTPTATPMPWYYSPSSSTETPALNPSFPVRAEIPGAINLVRNGDFSTPFEKDWQVWTERELGQGAAGAVAQSSEGESDYTGLVRFVDVIRQDLNHAEVDLTQQIDRVVPASGWMQARVVFRIWSHDVPRCGEFGTECPVMLRIRWQSASGEEHEWIQGFYAFEAGKITEPAMCIGCGMPRPFIQVPANQWYAYESENLLFDLHDTSSQNLPRRVKSISLAASGNSFHVQFANVELLVRKTPPKQVAKSIPYTYTLRHSTVAELLNSPPHPGEEVELDAYFGNASLGTCDITSFLGSINCDNHYPRNGTTCTAVAGAALTDYPYSPLLPDMLLTAVAPGSRVKAIPYHARLRGHFDRASLDCAFQSRTFTVVDVVKIYCEGNCPPQFEQIVPPAPTPDTATWARYSDSSTGISLLYPPGYEAETDYGTITLSDSHHRMTIRPFPPVLQGPGMGILLDTIRPASKSFAFAPVAPGQIWADRAGWVVWWQTGDMAYGIAAVMKGKNHAYVFTLDKWAGGPFDPQEDSRLFTGVVPSFTAPDLTP